FSRDWSSDVCSSDLGARLCRYAGCFVLFRFPQEVHTVHNLAQQTDAAFVQRVCFRRLSCSASSKASHVCRACGWSASRPRSPFIGDRRPSSVRMSTDLRVRPWRRRQDGGLCRDTACTNCARQDETRESHFSGSCAAPTLLADGRWPLAMTGQTKTHLPQPWRWAEPPSG